MSRHSRFPHRPPPWWSSDVPFPPRDAPDAEAARRLRQRFFRRFGIFFLLFFFLACSGYTVLIWLIASGASALGSGTILRPVGAIALLMGLGVLFMTLRAFRRAADPVGDVIEAAGRVANGDYSVQIRERGPREVRALVSAFNEMIARLKTNDEQRRRLLADVSHELRTPLTVIQGQLEGMLDGIYPIDHAHLEPVLDETRQLAHLIQDLRTLASAETGALDLQKEPIELATLINETVTPFHAQADSAGVQLVTEIAPALPVLTLDPARIRQVLENLLSNALRYTSRGGTIRVQAARASDRTVSISISDTGAGIPPQELPRIFERFFKAADSGGSGLGLAIAKNLVTAHGGEISAESELGKGTTIRFTLPFSSIE